MLIGSLYTQRRPSTDRRSRIRQETEVAALFFPQKSGGTRDQNEEALSGQMGNLGDSEGERTGNNLQCIMLVSKPNLSCPWIPELNSSTNTQGFIMFCVKLKHNTEIGHCTCWYLDVIMWANLNLHVTVCSWTNTVTGQANLLRMFSQQSFFKKMHHYNHNAI